jgi:hypothetical protein
MAWWMYLVASTAARTVIEESLVAAGCHGEERGLIVVLEVASTTCKQIHAYILFSIIPSELALHGARRLRRRSI